MSDDRALDGLAGETAELLSALIRNGCVNEGTPGQRRRTAQRRGAGHDRARGARPSGAIRSACRSGRRSSPGWTAPIPTAPTLLLLGHTDVVPVNAEDWRRDPFGGEIVDGEVWGRGAVDMLNQTSAMALAFARIAASNRRLRGTLVFAAVADEETGGDHGVVDILARRPELLAADVGLTEAGGTVTPTPSGPVIGATFAEKGMVPMRVIVHGRRRTRIDAEGRRQRAGHRRRGRAAHRPGPPGDAHQRRLAALGGGDGDRRGAASPAARRRPPVGRPRPPARRRARARPRLHPHDVHADGDPRRHRAQHRARPRRAGDRRARRARPSRRSMSSASCTICSTTCR